MKLSTQTLTQFQIVKNQPNFIHLKKIIFAEYDFIYHINDCYSIKQMSSFNNKNQLLFQKIDSKIKQMNLVIVDTIFPLILADVVLETFLNKVSTFYDYANSRNKIVINDSEFDRNFLEYKFKSFIHYLLFSNISSQNICKGDIDNDRVYYLKDQNGEINYYSIYEQKKLQEYLFQRMNLEINVNKSFLTKNELSLCLKILY